MSNPMSSSLLGCFGGKVNSHASSFLSLISSRMRTKPSFQRGQETESLPCAELFPLWQSSPKVFHEEDKAYTGLTLRRLSGFLCQITTPGKVGRMEERQEKHWYVVKMKRISVCV